MPTVLALIGFGEAARAFAPELAASLRGYDRKTDCVAERLEMLDAFANHDVVACESPAEALAGAAAVLSLVTPDQALAAACAGHGVEAGAFWFDLNSVAPDTKRDASARIEALGGRYVDVAVMAPVHPRRTATPLLVGGPHAAAGAAMLRAIGFSDVEIISKPVGAVAAIKMIRSVMVKGIEALSAECGLAAQAAGVRERVFASLEESWPGTDWAKLLDYNLDRMMTHGTRRAAEMEEVVTTLDALGTGSAMSRATIERQRGLGALALVAPPGLEAKLDSILAAVPGRTGGLAA